MRSKTFIKSLIVGTFILTSTAYGKKTDGQYSVRVDEKNVKVVPHKTFHLNVEAPATLDTEAEAGIKPQIKKETEMVFSLETKPKKIKVKFYVCDDAKTVCEQQTFQAAMDASKPVLTKETEKKESSKTELSAASKDRPTLYVFSAPWCPACIRLKTETLNQKDVQKILARVDVRQINIDLVENEDLSKKYDIQAIPTMILVDASGELVKRWLDYQSSPIFKAELEKSLKNQTTIVDILSFAEKGQLEAVSAAGQFYYSKMDWSNAVKWLEKSSRQEDLNLKLAAEIELARAAKETESNAKTNENVLSALEKGYTLTDSFIDEVRWKVDFIESTVESKKTIPTDFFLSTENKISKLMTSADLEKQFRLSTIGDYKGFEKIELIDNLRRLYEAQEKKEESQKTTERLLAELKKFKADYSKPGQIISLISYYGLLREYKTQETFYLELIKNNPQSYVYYQKYTNYLLKQKRFEEALVRADQALGYAEGNRPQLSFLKIKVLKELNRNEEALALIESTGQMISEHKTKYKSLANQLEELKKKLQK